MLILQQFDLTIVDKPGKENVVVDFLSRLTFPAGEEGIVDDQLSDKDLFSISVLSPWFANITNYFVSTQFPPNLSSKEKSKIIRKSPPSLWIGRNIFKLGPDQILRRCVKEEEFFDILLTYHDGPCEGHFAAKMISFIVLQAETKEIKATTEEKVSKFIRENVFYKFGYPRELVANQGSQFTSNMIEDLLSQHEIKHRTSTPYHPQANGQVEVTNRALEAILTKLVNSSRKGWADRLVKATWVYNTTWKTTTRFTPYELVYGKKALLSIKFEYNTLRMAA
eukprot:PITA_26606